jgi:hypothetical protein
MFTEWLIATALMMGIAATVLGYCIYRIFAELRPVRRLALWIGWKRRAAREHDWEYRRPVKVFRRFL